MESRDILVGDGESCVDESIWFSITLTIIRLYILEGIITIVFAFACIFLVPKDYSTAYFLTEEDKIVMKHRAELAESYSGGSGHYTKKDIKLAAKDVKSWVHGLIQICVVTILYGKAKIKSILIFRADL